MGLRVEDQRTRPIIGCHRAPESNGAKTARNHSPLSRFLFPRCLGVDRDFHCFLCPDNDERSVERPIPKSFIRCVHFEIRWCCGLMQFARRVPTTIMRYSASRNKIK